MDALNELLFIEKEIRRRERSRILQLETLPYDLYSYQYGRVDEYKVV